MSEKTWPSRQGNHLATAKVVCWLIACQRGGAEAFAVKKEARSRSARRRPPPSATHQRGNAPMNSTTMDNGMAGMSDAEKGREARKVASASLVGSAIEWYDFFIYGTATALVFREFFFPQLSPLMGTIVAFSTLAVG